MYSLIGSLYQTYRSISLFLVCSLSLILLMHSLSWHLFLPSSPHHRRCLLYPAKSPSWCHLFHHHVHVIVSFSASPSYPSNTASSTSPYHPPCPLLLLSCSLIQTLPILTDCWYVDDWWHPIILIVYVHYFFYQLWSTTLIQLILPIQTASSLADPDTNLANNVDTIYRINKAIPTDMEFSYEFL